MKIFAAFLSALFFSSLASAASLEDDVARYAAMFAGDQRVQSDVVKSLAWMGISDVRVFDLIERRALDNAQQDSSDRSKKEEVAFYIRALGFSGQSKYVPTLDKFVADGPYGRYAKNALEDLPNYRKWNPVISNRASFDPKYSDDVNRVMNMLHADDFLLKRVGAKRVYFGSKDAVLLDVLASQIRATYTRNGNDSETSDAIAWMVKALGSAKQDRYLPLLQEVAAQSSDRTVVRYAKRALER